MGLQNELGLPKPISPLEHEAILNIYYTSNQLRKKAAQFFRGYKVTDVQFNLLMLLKYQSGPEGGLTQVQLSRMLLVHRANITTLVDRMEKAGFVARLPVSTDRRYNLIKLTRQGIALVESVEEAYFGRVVEIMGTLSRDEMRSLMAMLERVRAQGERIEV